MSTRVKLAMTPSAMTAMDEPPSAAALTATSTMCTPLAVLASVSGIASASAVSAVLWLASYVVLSQIERCLVTPFR
jgi:hypothetical protein